MRNEKITPLHGRLSREDDFIPSRNIMNEFYARATSRKIRSVVKSKGMSGNHLRAPSFTAICETKSGNTWRACYST